MELRRCSLSSETEVNEMQVRGYIALLLSFAVLILLVSSLGLVGSIETPIEPKALFLIGLGIMLIILFRRHIEA